jgi:hypothetical protein
VQGVSYAIGSSTADTAAGSLKHVLQVIGSCLLIECTCTGPGSVSLAIDEEL